MENVALFFHLLGAFSFVAGTIVAGVAFETARRREAPAEIALLLGLSRIGVLLVALGTLLVLGFGLWLVHLGDLSYGAGWIDAAIGLLLAVAVLGAIGGQRPKRARKLASRLASEGAPASAELRALLDDRAALAVNYLSALLLLVIIVLMVFKPRAPHSWAGAPAGRRVRRPHGSRGERACPREKHVVLLVDVLVQVELEPVQPVKQRMVRVAEGTRGVVARGQLAQPVEGRTRLVVLPLEPRQLRAWHVARQERGKEPLLLVDDVLLELRTQRQEHVTHLVQLRPLGAVRRNRTLGEIGQSRQLPAQPLVMHLRDVGAEVGERRGRPIGALGPRRLEVALQENDHRRRVETPLGARGGQAVLAAAAVVEPEPLEHASMSRPLEHELGQAAGRIDRHRSASSFGHFSHYA